MALDMLDMMVVLDMNKHWTDEILYPMYDISSIEIRFIESMIRTMEWKGE